MRRRLLLELGLVVGLYCLIFGWRGNVLPRSERALPRIQPRTPTTCISSGAVCCCATGGLHKQLSLTDPSRPHYRVHLMATNRWLRPEWAAGACDLKLCTARAGTTSGYCECEGGRRANEVGCFHKEFTCIGCRGDREWQLPA